MSIRKNVVTLLDYTLFLLAETGGANASITFNANVRKQERVLENRLDTALKRFNSLLAANSLLRSEIDNLRNERERYENLSQSSENELKNLRSQLVECIDHSVIAYEQRKDANAKAVMLQNKAETDKIAAEAEMRELERQISHDRKLRDFMKLKAQERQEDEELVTYRKRKEAESAEKRRKDKEEHSVQAYETKFRLIQEISGESDLRKLVDKFIEVEDKNFALFNYVNELNNQIESLQEEILDTKNRISDFRNQSVELEDEHRKKIKELEQKRSQAITLANEYEEKTQITKKILDQCRSKRVLENRLDTALKRFNSLLAANSLLRSEIDNLRNERERYENLSQSSENELKNLRSQLVECIDHSVIAYEQRKDANAKAVMLQNKAETDKIAAEAEMRELERQISHDRKLRDFMKLKAQERQEDEELVTYRKRKEAESAEKRRKDKEEHSVQAYETKFRLIQEISGESDLRKLVDKFIEVEDKNFALFNYVNELNNQIESLQEEILDTKNRISDFRNQSVELEDEHRKKIKELEQKRSQAITLANEYEEKTQITKKILDQCRSSP
ncbi:unnamed protein product [Adineta steineri]|uniref:ODAD1 central coiled coil region domain-containing protein n=1 Tax=Adineta steineri TaxID=433720 RepID=A0A813M8P8_9BILA|nr:unnamed protein product [Adineta steineri]